MLYIFHVETGMMMTFDINLALETVAHLKGVISKECKIPEEKQVLLASGGETLDHPNRVCSYSAGTDTSPIFLFSKVAIESPSPPVPSIDYGTSPDMKIYVESCIDLPSTYETVLNRAHLAQQFHELAKKQASTCKNLVHDQHLQQQGWAAVVANLDDITRAFRSRTETFKQNFSEYLQSRSYKVELLHNFSHDLSLLSKIPILPSLLCGVSQQVTDSLHGDSTALTLLQWISSQDNQSSLEHVADQCLRGLEQFSGSTLHVLCGEIADTLEKLDNADMKEVKGLEARLYGLEKLMFEAQRIVREQNDLAQAFVQNQTRASNIGDTSILPDLCTCHSKQLQLMLKNHVQLEGILQRCMDAKKELSSNLHIRLGWIMYVEGKISDLDNKLSIYHEHLKRLKCHLDVVEQIHLTPQVYIAAVVEVVRRREFSTAFMQWANSLSEHSVHEYEVEVTTRKAFNEKIANHFLQSLFPGMEDLPPPFAINRPEPFDQELPSIFEEDVEELKKKLPEFVENFISLSENTEKHIATVQKLSEFTEYRFLSNEQQNTTHRAFDSRVIARSKMLTTSDEEDLAARDFSHVQQTAEYTLREQITEKEQCSCVKKIPVTSMEVPGISHRDWKEYSGEGFEPFGSKEESEFFPKPVIFKQCFHQHRAADSEHKKVLTEKLGIRKAHSDGDIKKTLRDFPLSNSNFVSHDFLTADFYIDESLPSSYTESNGTSGAGRGSHMVKSHHQVIAELQKQLEEKHSTLLDVQEELQSNKLKLYQLQSTVTALEDLAKLVQRSLRSDLANLQDKVLQSRQGVLENLLSLSSKVQQAVEHVHVELGQIQKQAVQEVLDIAEKEHLVEIQHYQQQLDVKMHKLKDAHQEIEVYHQQMVSQADMIDNVKHELETSIQQFQREIEKERKEVLQKMTMENEFELESLGVELMKTSSEGIQELSLSLKEKETQSQLLYKDKQSFEEALIKCFHQERAVLIQNMEEKFQEHEKKTVEWAIQEAHKNHQKQLERVQKEKEEYIEILKKEITQELENKWQDKVLQLKEELFSEHQKELKDKLAVLENQHEEEIKVLHDKLEQAHKNEMQSLQYCFRMDNSTKTVKEVMDLDTHEQTVADLQQQFEAEENKLLAQAVEIEKRAWEVKLQSTAEELLQKHENEMVELSERLNREHQDQLGSLKARMHAEKQVIFNQAAAQVTREKDVIIEKLKREKEELEMHWKQERGRVVSERTDISSDQRQLFAEAIEREKKTRESVMEVSTREDSHSSACKSLCTSSAGDKVSVLTCNIGDVILLCYDDRYQNYLAFYLGPVLHFLHTDSLDALGLKTMSGEPRKLYTLAEVTNKEYCQAKKAQNRYKLSVGSRFYRIKAKSWSKETQSRRQPRGGSTGRKHTGNGNLTASTI
ncbi:RB1-inducible coiled-coil protein 1-like isoform X2 [Limulus polyphemus]|uniref:RB1-inducible coiled-coil protein 1-like isoform X2 n=1 Tax=Limulus polyphemus TaxID=6850 RepID=A0ABM1SXS3_LIMPO|nr:RB1-inducible coiled-coil protein 1-like isoform X2 [Limulus polyphemus]